MGETKTPTAKEPGPPPVEREPTGADAQEAAQKHNLGLIVAGLNREDRYQQFLDLLGSKAAVDRWKAIALHTISTNSDILKKADPYSVIEACREAAVLGLDVTGLRGEGWLIVYGSTAKFQPGWQGLLKVILDTGRIRVADCQLVYQKDQFSISLGTEPRVVHTPVLSGEAQTVSKGVGEARRDEQQFIVDRGDIVGAYAYAKLDSGELLVEWMTYADIEQARKASPAVQNNRSSPWDNWWGEMARKTVIRRLMKRLPRTAKVGQAIELDAQADQKERELLEAIVSKSLTARDKAVAALPGFTPTEAEKSGEHPPEAVVVGAEEGGDAKPVGDAKQPLDTVIEERAKEGDPDQPSSAEQRAEDAGQPTEQRLAEERGTCNAESPYGGKSASCEKPAGHDGIHRNGEKETWS